MEDEKKIPCGEEDAASETMEQEDRQTEKSAVSEEADAHNGARRPQVPEFRRSRRIEYDPEDTDQEVLQDSDGDECEEDDERDDGETGRRVYVPDFIRNRRHESEASQDDESPCESSDEEAYGDDYYDDDNDDDWDDDFDRTLPEKIMDFLGLVRAGSAPTPISFKWWIVFAVLAVLILIGLLAPDDHPIEAEYLSDEARAPITVYVPVGETVSFTVQAGEEELVQLDEQGRVNIGIEYAGTTEEAEQAICTLSAVRAEDPAHRSNPQVYTVSGLEPGTTTANFDLYYDRYRVNSKGEFSASPAETYQHMAWASVVISVYPTSTEIRTPFESVRVVEGTQFDLQYEIYPEEAQYAQVGFASSDESVAWVDDSGRVHARAEGTAVISMKLSGGSSRAEVTVEVLSGLH